MSAVPDKARCLDCNYALRGLSSNRCPECGRTFDPHDPFTMNVGRPMPRWAQWIVSSSNKELRLTVNFASVACLYGSLWLPGGICVTWVGLFILSLLLPYMIVRWIAEIVVRTIYRQPAERTSSIAVFSRLAATLFFIAGVGSLFSSAIPRVTVALIEPFIAARLHRMYAVDPMPNRGFDYLFVGPFLAEHVNVHTSGVTIYLLGGGIIDYSEEVTVDEPHYRPVWHVDWSPRTSHRNYLWQ